MPARHPLKMDPPRASALLPVGAVLSALTPASAWACGNAMSGEALAVIGLLTAAALIAPSVVVAAIVWLLPERMLERRPLAAQIGGAVGISVALYMVVFSTLSMTLIMDSNVKLMLMGAALGLVMAPMIGPWIGAVADRARIDQLAPSLRRGAQIALGLYLIGGGLWMGVSPSDAHVIASIFAAGIIGMGLHSLAALGCLRLWRRRHPARY